MLLESGFCYPSWWLINKKEKIWTKNILEYLLRVLNEIGLGKSVSREGFGALELLGMTLKNELEEMNEHLDRIVKFLERRSR